jgi:Cu/Ag efflux pump CusA
MAGIEHVYSVSRPGAAMVTVQFKVGVPRTEALVRVRDTIDSHRDWAAPELGVGEPLVKPRSIDDVPILALTLASDDPSKGAFELERVAHAIEAELKRVPGTREVRTIGGPGRVVRVLLDADRLASSGVSATEVRDALAINGQALPSGVRVRGNREVHVEAGDYLKSEADVRAIVVGAVEKRPVRVADVAEVVDGPPQPTRYVWTAAGPAAASRGPVEAPAVTIEVTKKPGANAVDVAASLLERMEALRGTIIPGGRALPRDAQLRGDGGREGLEPHQEARLRHGVRRAAGAGGAGPPGSGHRRRGRRADPCGHALRLARVGLHLEPRVALRADLLDRHPRGRRDRGGGEHPSPARARCRAARRHHSRGG